MSVSASSIRKVLSSCAVNPKTNDGLKVILASGGYEYFLGKARECIAEDDLLSAITMLAIAQVTKENGT